jgi:hypothetical protein
MSANGALSCRNFRKCGCPGAYDRATHWFTVDVLDAAGEVVARVRKHLYVRPKIAACSPERVR